MGARGWEVENYSVQMPETSAKNMNICRVGFSLPYSSLFLGDSAESWGWGGTGKKSHNGKYEGYGTPFTAGDVRAPGQRSEGPLRAACVLAPCLPARSA